MPTRSELARRGGVKRVRRVSIDARRYMDIYVVRKPGKRGGQTVGIIHDRKGTN